MHFANIGDGASESVKIGFREIIIGSKHTFCKNPS